MNSNFTTAITVQNTAQEVYNAIINVRGWWQGEIDGSAVKVNDTFTYRMGDFHFSEQRVTELVPYEKIAWFVTSAKLNFVENKTEWTGTSIVFEIKNKGKKTELIFTHQGLTPPMECYDACSDGWEKLIRKSLFSLITSGSGTNVF